LLGRTLRTVIASDCAYPLKQLRQQLKWNNETMTDAIRRDYLIAKALAYCVAAMERLPFYRRELSDQKDMQTLFDTIIIPEADREQLRREARERFPPAG
jgi:hypothetical protein